MGSKPKTPKPPPPPPPPPAPPPPPTPMARRAVKQASAPSVRATAAGSFGGAALPRRKPAKTTKVQGRSTLGGGSGLYG